MTTNDVTLIGKNLVRTLVSYKKKPLTFIAGTKIKEISIHWSYGFSTHYKEINWLVLRSDRLYPVLSPDTHFKEE